ncbi:MAG: O-acetyl-ADP-ribose deacetylase [Thermoplasmata archaeon]|nr:O-acetyl-ADP-ribose deacetylase [Thermoplasmata archaeon]
MPLEIILGDITKLDAEAIVNAANNSLLGGGGVDGAIHAAAGPELLEECRKLNGCETGKAKITRGYSLPAKWVIHTVGPVWRGGGYREDELLAKCYRNSMKLAAENGIREIAFPSISTGAYRFPLERAADIAVREIMEHIESGSQPGKVMMVCFNERVQNAYENSLKTHMKN